MTPSFCPPDGEILASLKNAIITFQLVSGLKVNYHKSTMYGINVIDSSLEALAALHLP